MSRTLKKRDGDIVLLSSTGRAYLVGGIEKLSQDVADAMMTEYDPNRQYGSTVATLDGVNSTPRGGPLGLINRGMIKTAVRDSLERLKELQTQRIDQLSQFEAIESIGTVRIIQFSRTGYMFAVDVTPVAGPDKVPTTFFINLRHQFLQSARPNLPGSVITDDFRGI